MKSKTIKELDAFYKKTGKPVYAKSGKMKGFIKKEKGIFK